jgi:hypothetical protein
MSELSPEQQDAQDLWQAEQLLLAVHLRELRRLPRAPEQLSKALETVAQLRRRAQVLAGTYMPAEPAAAPLAPGGQP